MTFEAITTNGGCLNRVHCIKVKSQAPQRVLNSITHPLRDDVGNPKEGHSRLTLATNSYKIPAELTLMLGLLSEEYQAQISFPVEGLGYYERREPVKVREREPSFIELDEGGQIALPPPAPTVTFEFNIRFQAKKEKVHVVFDELTFTYPRPEVVYAQPKACNILDASTDAGGDLEASGIWHIQARNQGTGAPRGHNKRCKARRA